MKILWRLSIKEEDKEKLQTVFSVKFGDDLETYDQIYQRFIEIQNMGVQISGIHFHAGSSAQGSSSFKKAVQLAHECMEIGKALGHPMEILDLGGGFP